MRNIYLLRKALALLSVIFLTLIIAFVLLRFFYLPIAIDEILATSASGSIVSATHPGSSQAVVQSLSSISKSSASVTKEAPPKIVPLHSPPDSHASTSILDSNPVVYANFKINSIEGGERGHITVDGNPLRYRSNVPLIPGIHEVQITRVGYVLDYVEMNGKHISARDGRVLLNFTNSSGIQRIVFFMYKL